MLNLAQNDREVSQIKVLGHFVDFHRVYIKNFHVKGTVFRIKNPYYKPLISLGIGSLCKSLTKARKIEKLNFIYTKTRKISQRIRKT